MLYPLGAVQNSDCHVWIICVVVLSVLIGIAALIIAIAVIYYKVHKRRLSVKGKPHTTQPAQVIATFLSRFETKSVSSASIQSLAR